MAGDPPDVKRVSNHEPSRVPAGVTGPEAYSRWRATTLGRVTEALEQHRIRDLIGPADGRRVLDLGSGDGLLTAALARLGAFAVGIDIDRSMLRAAVARKEPGQVEPPRYVEGQLERCDPVGA